MSCPEILGTKLRRHRLIRLFSAIFLHAAFITSDAIERRFGRLRLCRQALSRRVDRRHARAAFAGHRLQSTGGGARGSAKRGDLHARSGGNACGRRPRRHCRTQRPPCAVGRSGVASGQACRRGQAVHRHARRSAASGAGGARRGARAVGVSEPALGQRFPRRASRDRRRHPWRSHARRGAFRPVSTAGACALARASGAGHGHLV